jgi:hypothetical protein
MNLFLFDFSIYYNFGSITLLLTISNFITLQQGGNKKLSYIILLSLFSLTYYSYRLDWNRFSREGIIVYRNIMMNNCLSYIILHNSLILILQA